MNQYTKDIGIVVNAASEQEATRITDMIWDAMRTAALDLMVDINDWDTEQGCFEFHVGQPYELTCPLSPPMTGEQS